MTPARYIRKAILGLTQAKLGKLLGVSQPSVQRWEQSGCFPAAYQPRIRQIGKEKSPDWSDSWFFEVPIKADDANA
jgi:transcriptional regulator with XRE-family HTH domain